MGILPNSQFGDIAVVDVTGKTGYSDVRVGTSGVTVQNFAEIKTDSSFLVKPSSTPSSPILLLLLFLVLLNLFALVLLYKVLLPRILFHLLLN